MLEVWKSIQEGYEKDPDFRYIALIFGVCILIFLVSVGISFFFD